MGRLSCIAPISLGDVASSIRYVAWGTNKLRVSKSDFTARMGNPIFGVVGPRHCRALCHGEENKLRLKQDTADETTHTDMEQLLP